MVTSSSLRPALLLMSTMDSPFGRAIGDRSHRRIMVRRLPSKPDASIFQGKLSASRHDRLSEPTSEGPRLPSQRIRPPFAEPTSKAPVCRGPHGRR